MNMTQDLISTTTIIWCENVYDFHLQQSHGSVLILVRCFICNGRKCYLQPDSSDNKDTCFPGPNSWERPGPLLTCTQRFIQVSVGAGMRPGGARTCLWRKWVTMNWAVGAPWAWERLAVLCGYKMRPGTQSHITKHHMHCAMIFQWRIKEEWKDLRRIDF